ncbi:MAG: EamA family transporter, partial [Chloroflexi bacterium]|nr:EamA family transporter [Chloroflexota bacterium]
WLRPGEQLGIAIVSAGLLGFALFGILGREVARDQQIGTLSLTAMPLAFGGGFLLLVALPLEGLPNFAAIAWAIVLWLAIINTAFAYVLYNHSLQVLTALEMNIMLNLTPLGTAVLAWLFLGETLTIVQIVGVVTVISGVIFVQQARVR